MTQTRSSGGYRLVLHKLEGQTIEGLSRIANPDPAVTKGEEVRDALTSIIWCTGNFLEEFQNESYFLQMRDKYLGKKSAYNKRSSQQASPPSSPELIPRRLQPPPQRVVEEPTGYWNDPVSPDYQHTHQADDSFGSPSMPIQQSPRVAPAVQFPPAERGLIPHASSDLFTSCLATLERIETTRQLETTKREACRNKAQVECAVAFSKSLEILSASQKEQSLAMERNNKAFLEVIKAFRPSVTSDPPSKRTRWVRRED